MALQMLTVLVVALAVTQAPNGVEARSVGAPYAACNNMVPGHGAESQSAASSPFEILHDMCQGYQAGKLYTVTLRGPPFKGFFCRLQKKGTVHGRDAVGTWDARYLPSYTRHSSCDRPSTGVTHARAHIPWRTVTFKWLAPSTDQGTLQVTCSMAQTRLIFWTALRSNDICFNPSPSAISCSVRAHSSSCSTRRPVAPVPVPGNTGGSPGSCTQTCPAGPPGPTGARGPQGYRGPSGAQGANGFPGPQGPPGRPAPAGPSGSGSKGAKGERGFRGYNGQTGARGSAGQKGDQGRAGPPGPAGPPGFTSSNGGRSLPGIQGPKGSKGEPGLRGATGRSIAGEKGVRGSRGYDGLKGDKGNAGTSGRAGTQGSVGPRGPRGYAGAPGPAGRTTVVQPDLGAVENRISTVEADVSSLKKASSIINPQHVQTMQSQISALETQVADMSEKLKLLSRTANASPKPCPVLGDCPELPPVATPTKPQSCQCRSPLGVESGAVRDAQFSASSAIPGLSPEEARLNIGKAWVPMTVSNQYLDIDLRQSRKITGVTIQGKDFTDYWVKDYTIMVRNRSGRWETVKDKSGATQVCKGSSDASTPVLCTLNCNAPTIAESRYVRIVPGDYNRFIALRVEIHGC